MADSITIVGLGPGDADLLTIRAWRALENASEVYLRTERHPTVPALPKGPMYHSFDDIYEQHERFEDVYEAIAERVLALGARPEGVVYAVPGHPLVGETASWRIVQRAADSGLKVKVIDGLSYLDPVLAALGVDSFDGLQVCDAMLLAGRHHPPLDPDVPALIVQVYDRRMAADVKMTLMNLYHDDHPVRIVRAAASADVSVIDLPLFELDRRDDLDHLTSVYVPALASPGSLSSYQDVVATLRAPGGCPWDREQTHSSLRTHLLEETYEVLAALDDDDMGELQEELGDLLLQVLLHAQIASEEGDFKLIDSARTSIEKLVRRHPHVFGNVEVNGSDDVLRNWEQIKREEKGAGGEFQSMLSGINKALPALSQAMEIQRRVARVGFDWPDEAPVLAKVAEEIGELRDAKTEDDQASEFGDILFSLVNVSRWKGIDAESALREANGRFARRFSKVEKAASESGRALEEMTLDEMDALWERAKTIMGD